MSKIRVVQYINQFFAQIGGEEKADIPAELREGPVGPGLALNQAWGDEAEVVATVICGDRKSSSGQPEHPGPDRYVR